MKLKLEAENSTSRISSIAAAGNPDAEYEDYDVDEATLVNAAKELLFNIFVDVSKRHCGDVWYPNFEVDLWDKLMCNNTKILPYIAEHQALQIKILSTEFDGWFVDPAAWSKYGIKDPFVSFKKWKKLYNEFKKFNH